MKLNQLTRTLLLSLGVASALGAMAYDVQVGDAYYNLDTEAATATATYVGRTNATNSMAYVGDVVIPETFDLDGVTYTVTAIDARTFSYCAQMTSLVIPATVTSIGENFCYACSTLSSVVINGPVETLSNMSFQACAALADVALPPTVKSIGMSAFANCTALQHIALPTGCESIANNAFYNCTALSEIDLPATLRTIDFNAFVQCNSLVDVTFPDALESIGTYAFQNCRALTTIRFGKSMREISPFAFSGCGNLCEVYCTAATPPASSYASCFYDTGFHNTATGQYGGTAHFPSEAVDKYAAKAPWKTIPELLPLQCCTPTVSVADGTLTFTTDTNLRHTEVGETFTYSIVIADVVNDEATVLADEQDELEPLALTYDITVQAHADRCESSAPAVASIVWRVDGDPVDVTTRVDRPIAAEHPVVVRSEGGSIVLSGLTDGEPVAVYSLDGRLVGRTTASGTSARLDAARGQTVVVRLGRQAFKVRVR